MFRLTILRLPKQSLCGITESNHIKTIRRLQIGQCLPNRRLGLEDGCSSHGSGDIKDKDDLPQQVFLLFCLGRHEHKQHVLLPPPALFRKQRSLSHARLLCLPFQHKIPVCLNLTGKSE